MDENHADEETQDPVISEISKEAKTGSRLFKLLSLLVIVMIAYYLLSTLGLAIGLVIWILGVLLSPITG